MQPLRSHPKWTAPMLRHFERTNEKNSLDKSGLLLHAGQAGKNRAIHVRKFSKNRKTQHPSPYEANP